MNEATDTGAGNGALLALLIEQEEKLLSPGWRTSREAVAELLADDFVEFSRSGGIYDRDQTIAALAVERPVFVRRAFDFRISLLGETAALLTYRSVRRSTSDPNEEQSLRSSIWVRDQGRWRLRFHQGTPA